MSQSNAAPHRAAHLVLISFLALFLEMALIRYINSTVQVIAYFNNFLILSAFLGLGFGSLLTGYKKDLFRYFPIVFAVVVALMTYLDSFGYASNHEDLVFWFFLGDEQGRGNLPVSLVVVAVFFTNFLFFIPLGERLGRCLNQFENRLLAYGLDLFGSVLGVAGFGLVSYLQTPPIVWFLFSGLLILIITGLELQGKALLIRGTLAVLGVGAAVYCAQMLEEGFWSPYYKITYEQHYQDPETETGFLGYSIFVDKLRIQDALNFSDDLGLSRFRGWIDYYGLPYHLHKPNKVLILGGGSGNDATMALRYGAEHVNVVEIDPVIAGFGFDRHPQKPYADPRVSVIKDDARAYLRQSKAKYDMILMNALDSHHQVPGLSTLRLESFMYTVEAFQDVRKLMEPDAVFVVQLSSTRPWMGNRLFWSLTRAFDKQPRLFVTRNSPFKSIAFAFGPDEALSNDRFPGQGSLEELTDLSSYYMMKDFIELSTDDWPHLYLAEKRLPGVYVLILFATGILTFVLFSLVGAVKLSENIHMFLLGAGFMLLEARSITKVALLFGSTWIVNAIVIGGILSLILVGNLLVLKNRHPSKQVCFSLLFASLVLGYFVPVDFILQFGFALRVIAAGLWMGLPIFFASLIFSTSFRTVDEPAMAFGSNLLGVVLGGLLEYSSMVYGLNTLYLLAILLYVFALLVGRRDFRLRAS